MANSRKKTSLDDGIHNHCHHHHSHRALRNIGFAFALNFSFSLIELVGGLWIGSLAIVADAIHDFGDSVSLGLAWFLERFANRRRDENFHFGYRRFSLLSALISGVVITSGSGIVFYESIRRFSEPYTPAGLPMMGLALVGLVINGLAAVRLSTGSTQNERVLSWHLLEDVLGWGVIFVGAVIIFFTQVSWLDPLLAMALSLFVFVGVFRHLKDTAYLFLQGRPKNFDLDGFLQEALEVPGVEKIDHVAVWSLDGETSVLSARLHLHSVRDPQEIESVKSRVRVAASRQLAQATLETCLAKKRHGESSHASATEAAGGCEED